MNESSFHDLADHGPVVQSECNDGDIHANIGCEVVTSRGKKRCKF